MIGLPVLANLTPEPGRLAPGLASDGSAGLSGTSLAAPWVARQVCNAIAADPTLDSKAKVCARLRESVGRGRELSIDPPILWT